MPMGMGIGISPALGGATWTPARANPTLWMDATLPGLYTNTAGTVDVTAAAQAIARGLDRSGRGNTLLQATGGYRPLFSLAPPVALRNRAVGSAAVENTAYWPASTTYLGVTTTKTAYGVRGDGRYYTRHQITGTATGTSALTLQGFYAWTAPAAQGQTWTFSCTAKIVSGTPNGGGYGFRLEVLGETSGGVYTGDNAGSSFLTATSDTSLTATINLARATTQRVRHALTVSYASGQTLNYTVEVVEPQLELGAVRTTYQPNFGPYWYTEPGYPTNGGMYFDRTDDAMTATLAAGFTGDELLIGRSGYRVTAKTIAAGGTYTLSPPAAIGDLIAVVLAPTMSAATIGQMTSYYAPRGGSLVAV
jgi:hypothetical protein